MTLTRAAFGTVFTWLVCLGAASAQTTVRISEGLGLAFGGGRDPSISADGRFVAFVSDGTDLVPGDVNGQTDVFLRDLQLGTTTLVSVSSSGAQGNQPSSQIVGPDQLAVSADGRFVAFASYATNLVLGDTNGQLDVFVRDVQLGTTTRASVGSAGEQGNGRSLWPSISADGRYVAFTSESSTLVPVDANAAAPDVFLRDLLTGTTTLVSVSSAGVQGNTSSYLPAISADGTHVAFVSNATNLSPDANGPPARQQIFVRNLVAGTTVLASPAFGGGGANDHSGKSALSVDGRYVAFESRATDLVPGDTNSFQDVFVRDLVAGTTERVSVTSSGVEGNGYSDDMSISANGRHVAFASTSTNLALGDTNGGPDVFVHDRDTNVTTRASTTSKGLQGGTASERPSISADGTRIAFRAYGTNFFPGDGNHVSDVYVRDVSAGTATLASESLGPPIGDDRSDAPSVSADGRFVAFASLARNLELPDDNEAFDVFVRDVEEGTTVRVSVDPTGLEANGESNGPSISSDGRHVAFRSLASNLVVGDTNAKADIFVRDLVLGTTSRVTVGPGGVQADGGSGSPSISSDGRFVAFESIATNLAPVAPGGGQQVLVCDRSTGAITLASATAGGVTADDISYAAALSADGKWVAFNSRATNLAAGDPSHIDVYLKHLASGAVTRVSVTTSGGHVALDCVSPSISADGRYVAFDSVSSNIVSGDTNNDVDVFVRDVLAGTTIRASVGTGGVQATNDSVDASISADGRYVAFLSLALNLVPGDTANPDVFLRELAADTTECVSLRDDGSLSQQHHAQPALSADAKRVAFASLATNLVSGDNNNDWDVYLRDRGIASPFAALCPGDGVLMSCPCGNNGAIRRGCQNSAGTGGALLTAEGVPCLGDDTVTLNSVGELPSAFSIVLQGNLVIATVNFGDGLRCAGGSLKRLYSLSAVGGAVTVPRPSDLPISARSQQLGDTIPYGANRVYQVYYRDPNASFCPPPAGSAFNATNAILIAWGC